MLSPALRVWHGGRRGLHWEFYHYNFLTGRRLVRYMLAFKGLVRFFSRLETGNMKTPISTILSNNWAGWGGGGGWTPQLAEHKLMSAWSEPLGLNAASAGWGTPRKINIPTTGFSLLRSKPDLAPLPHRLSFLALFPLEAETSKMNATPSRWKSCFCTIVDVYTGDSTWGGKGFLGGWWDSC